MPELPEMENYMRLLTPRMVGRVIQRTEITREKSLNVSVPVFQETVHGQTVSYIERRAKHLLFAVGTEHVLVLHLMLGGMMFWGRPEDKPDRTVQVMLDFGGEGLHLIGLRLGYLHLHSIPDARRLLAKLGPEPLAPDFGEGDFRTLVARKRGALKPILVDQSFLSGIGNCYSDEICFAAGILPDRRIESLTEEEVGRLYRSMRSILEKAAAGGGYMEMPLYMGDTLTGGYDSQCKVYDREGEPCVQCGSSIVRHDFASRKSFCCSVCQR